MKTKNIYYSMIALTALLSIGVIGSFIISLKIMSAQSSGLVDLKIENHVLDNQQLSLAKAQKAIKKYSELNEIAKSVVPQDKDQAKTVRDISSIADSLNIKLSAITFPPSTLGASNSTSSSSTKTKSKETQVTPVKGIPKVYEMQITVQQDKEVPVSYETFLLFFKKLEKNRRTSQVANINITPDEKNRNNLSFNLVLRTYIKP